MSIMSLLDDVAEVFNIQDARSIHQNIIRVYAWPYEKVDPHPALTSYIKGKHCLAFLNENTNLEIVGLKEGINIEWDKTMGVIQTYIKGDDDESCD